MEKNYVIETLGFITKEENLTTVDTHILPGTLVLENLDIFPGYHGENLPGNDGMGYIYLLIKEKLRGGEMMRMTERVRNYSKIDFDATLGEVCIENATYPCIRLRNLPGYEKIAEIQLWYQDQGVSFVNKQSFKSSALIMVKKFFMLEHLTDNIYKDLEVREMTYLHIPAELQWQLFKKITRLVKNNMEDRNFDAALGGIYRKRGLIDVVRIYDSAWTKEKLEMIRQTYLDVIKKFV